MFLELIKLTIKVLKSEKSCDKTKEEEKKKTRTAQLFKISLLLEL